MFALVNWLNLKAALKNVEIEKKQELSEEEAGCPDAHATAAVFERQLGLRPEHEGGKQVHRGSAPLALAESTAAGSVAEVAHSGEEHGDASFVRRRDHFVVADAAAGLDHRRRAGFDRG